ncbi:MAG: threonylcarbamoyl-AMP synthase [Candidatus Thermoplasmatota archaeon]|nr:threonylcarbamoyl-AMP synthase [Candidatus Thermoplasmatota archaeon]
MKKDDLLKATNALRKGQPIIYPTDTLYALGVDIYNQSAVRKVFEIKKRPLTVPLPVAVHSVEAMETIACMNTITKRVCETFLPGSVTIILRKKSTVPDIVTSGSHTIAVRVPNHPIAMRLLSEYGPLTVTSANIHQKKTQGIIKDILKQLKTDIPVCLHDGRLEGVPSTIVDLSIKKPKIIRKGSITEKEIWDVISHG